MTVPTAAGTQGPDLAIANSGFVADSVASLFPNVPAPVMHYPVALVDTPEAPEWRAAARRELGVDDQTAVIIQVSRYEEWKGHLLHLRAHLGEEVVVGKPAVAQPRLELRQRVA